MAATATSPPTGESLPVDAVHRLVPEPPESLWYSLKRRVLGPPLVSGQLDGQRLSRPLALGVLSCDGLSSAAYGTEETLYALLPFFGLAAFTLVLPLTLLVLFGVLLVALLYREVVSVYTRAGGSYVVARELRPQHRPGGRGRAADRLRGHGGGADRRRQRRHRLRVPGAVPPPGHRAEDPAGYLGRRDRVHGASATCAASVAEFNSLKAGTLDYGYVPAYDASLIPELTSQGYKSNPWVSWGFNYMPVNFNNPTVGPLFKQLYIRQAFQYMVNQPVDIKKAMYGFGAPDYGPVPTAPKTSYESSQASVNPYPFDPAKATALLKSHGWKVKAGGTSTCAKPGTGATDCGAGIAKGEQLNFNLVYPTGSTATTVMMEQYKTNLASAGIQLNLQAAPVNTVFSELDKCTSGPSCKWQILSWSVGYTYGPNFMPTGEETFASTGSFNFGNYASPLNDANILATVTNGSSSSMFKYENYLEDQLPVIWQPKADSQISEISTSLKGVTQSPTLNFTPENWTITK